MAEHSLGKGEVPGPIPGMGTNQSFHTVSKPLKTRLLHRESGFFIDLFSVMSYHHIPTKLWYFLMVCAKSKKPDTNNWGEHGTDRHIYKERQTHWRACWRQTHRWTWTVFARQRSWQVLRPVRLTKPLLLPKQLSLPYQPPRMMKEPWERGRPARRMRARCPRSQVWRYDF